jgi:hypothetical protein
LIGILLLVLLATGLIVPYVILRSLTAPPAAFLEVAARMPIAIRLSVLQLFVGASLSVAISVAMFTLMRTRARGLGLWVLALALANFILQLVESSHWLTMLSVSQAFAGASPSDAERFQFMGIAVRAAWKWAHYSHIFVVVAWLFAWFLLLYRTTTVPRVLAVLGMCLCVLHFIGITLPVFAGSRMPFPTLFGMPLGFGILATSVWLMAKGFRNLDGAEASEGRDLVLER